MLVEPVCLLQKQMHRQAVAVRRRERLRGRPRRERGDLRLVRHLCRRCEGVCRWKVTLDKDGATAARRLVTEPGINERKQKNPNETRNGAADSSDGLSGHGGKWIFHHGAAAISTGQRGCNEFSRKINKENKKKKERKAPTTLKRQELLWTLVV